MVVALLISSQSLRLQLRKGVVDKVKVRCLIETTSEKVAGQINLQKTDRDLLVCREHDVPAGEGYIRTKLEVGVFCQLEHGSNVWNGLASHLNVFGVRMNIVRVMRSPWTRKPLKESKTIPMCVGCSTEDLTRLDIDIKENRVMIRRCVQTTGSKDTRKGRHLGRLGRECSAALGNDTKGRERCWRGEQS